MLTHEKLAELRRLANNAVPSAEWFLSQHLDEVPFIDGAAAKFIVAANPEAILRMLSMLNALQARIAELEKKAALHDQIMRACGELPEGWEIVIELENGAGTVSLFDPEYREVEYPEDHESMAHAVGDAIDAALTWPEDTSDYGSRIAVIGQNGNDGISYKEQK